MMAYAHAGLLVFTPAAMTRPDWIRKEANILSWRQSLDPGFQLFYTLHNGVTRQELSSAGFDPADLGQVQALRATDPVDIATEIKRLNAPPVGMDTPFEELIFYFTQNLKLDAAALNKLADDLGAPAVLTWLGTSTASGIQRIAARVLAGRFGTLRTLSGVINVLTALGVQKPALKKMMRWAGPYWLAPEVSGRLATAADLHTKPDGGLAAINGNCVLQYTAKMIVYKTYPFRFNYLVSNFESGTHRVDAEYYTAAICNWLRKRDQKLPYDEQVGYPDDDGELMAQLKQRRPFLFVPIKTPDESTVQTLRANFPTVVFLLCTGPDLERIEYMQLPVIALEPAVDGTRETAEYSDWNDALTALGG